MFSTVFTLPTALLCVSTYQPSQSRLVWLSPSQSRLDCLLAPGRSGLLGLLWFVVQMWLSLHLTGCALRGGGLVVPLHGVPGLGLGLLDVREGLGHVVDLVCGLGDVPVGVLGRSDPVLGADESKIRKIVKNRTCHLPDQKNPRRGPKMACSWSPGRPYCS